MPTIAKRLLPRGGARNCADRQSLSLTAVQCANLLDAAARAIATGRPFNRFITILWERGGIEPRRSARVTGAFIKLVADWLRRRGYRLAWAWVQEYSNRRGAHVHMLLHIPPILDSLFRVMPLRWIKGLIPGRYCARMLDSQKIGGAGAGDLSTPFYSANLARKLRYMLKAAPAEFGTEVGLTRKGECSLVYGKRLAVWQHRR